MNSYQKNALQGAHYLVSSVKRSEKGEKIRRLFTASSANPHHHGNCGAWGGTPLPLSLPPEVATTASGKRRGREGGRWGKGVGLTNAATRGALNVARNRQMRKVISLDAACTSSGEIKANEMWQMSDDMKTKCWGTQLTKRTQRADLHHKVQPRRKLMSCSRGVSASLIH